MHTAAAPSNCSTKIATSITQSFRNLHDVKYQNQHRLSFLLRSCKTLRQLEQIHVHLIKFKLHIDLSFVPKLISLYSEFGFTSSARLVFDSAGDRNIYVYNSMVKAYSLFDSTHENSLRTFSQMLSDDVIPNEFSFPYLLKSCDFIEEGKQIHAHLLKCSNSCRNVFVCAALIDMYIRFGCVDSYAQHMFDKMTEKDLVCWNTMISGYSKSGNYEKVIIMFKNMLDENIKPRLSTILNVLCACGETGALVQGRWLHQLVKNTNCTDRFVDAALVTMYSKCGDISCARQVFDESHHRDLVLWSAMISGYGFNGYGEDALEVFKLMRKEGIQPDNVTFVSLLSACSHSGLIEEGLELFDKMKRLYNIEPQTEHYACVVDLLGRAGRLAEAEKLISNMSVMASVSTYGALLGACRVHGEVELGERVAEKLFEIEGHNGGNYVLLCNIYKEAGRSTDALKLRIKMRKEKIKKSPGYSFIEIGNKVHRFKSGSKTHPQSVYIYEVLHGLTLHLENNKTMERPNGNSAA